MKFGVREICDVVLKAKAAQKVGNKIFYKDEPVIYFDTLKTSSLEGAATTVYAQGGRGNARLVAWEGERTVTFTMEDALISPAGFMILSGAGLIEGSDDEDGKKIKVHTIEQTDEVEVTTDGSDAKFGDDGYKVQSVTIDLDYEPFNDEDSGENFVYVMVLNNGEVATEPFIPAEITGNQLVLKADDDLSNYFYKGCVVLVDYYREVGKGASQINITPDKFGGNYYLEASTLFRDTNGVDMPAEFIIPNCKIQSNFTFTMASSGDPSTFTFTMDAFPDYTRFDKTKKVLAAIQMIEASTTNAEARRKHTDSQDWFDDLGVYHDGDIEPKPGE